MYSKALTCCIQCVHKAYNVNVCGSPCAVSGLKPVASALGLNVQCVLNCRGWCRCLPIPFLEEESLLYTMLASFLAA